MNLEEKRARLIAYYLPQFHPIPENDKWWGKGFTEWANVAKAKPLFKGHIQPKLPSDLGFYDLRVPEVRQQQADLARLNGIEGFSYWHYWFGGGKRILEKVINDVLASGQPNFPFSFAWANTSWTGHWHGLSKDVLMKQDYFGVKDYTDHFYSVLPAFSDSRYIKVDGKPLFTIFHPWDIPNPKEFTDLWRNLAVKEGLKGVFFVGIENNYDNIVDYGMDGYTTHEPNSQRKIKEGRLKKYLRKLGYKEKPKRYDYADYVNVTNNHDLNDIEIPLVLSNWDNTPRSGVNGVVFENSTPELFRAHLKKAIDKLNDRPLEKKLVFVKSWNEWAEGNYLEPGLEYGHQYLDVLRQEIYG